MKPHFIAEGLQTPSAPPAALSISSKQSELLPLCRRVAGRQILRHLKVSCFSTSTLSCLSSRVSIVFDMSVPRRV
ncbi:hypothetical protein EYF80_034171 [Liparis tanakae]|uniref:Uncharacterized protein n=1 Tax=Liparis tanakae TaxID=230148 RepID=A0A4Z2GRB4_9TELE|nr:hypothetical protein EYF80_034171 [Liparis tanakae]